MSSVGKLHNGSDHIVVCLSEDLDGCVSGAFGVLHNHVNVRSSQTVLGEGCAVVLNLSLILGSGDGFSSGLVLKLLGLGLREARVGVLKS